MKLTVVGCAGSYPTPESPASCYLIEHDGQSIVVDLGNGALGPLQGYVDPVADEGLAGVILSHCHVDHCSDVASLYVMRRYAPSPSARRLPLIGPVETAGRMAAIYGMADTRPLEQVFEVGSLAGGRITIGPFDVQAIRAFASLENLSNSSRPCGLQGVRRIERQSICPRRKE